MHKISENIPAGGAIGNGSDNKFLSMPAAIYNCVRFPNPLSLFTRITKIRYLIPMLNLMENSRSIYLFSTYSVGIKLNNLVFCAGL